MMVTRPSQPAPMAASASATAPAATPAPPAAEAKPAQALPSPFVESTKTAKPAPSEPRRPASRRAARETLVASNSGAGSQQPVPLPAPQAQTPPPAAPAPPVEQPVVKTEPEPAVAPVPPPPPPPHVVTIAAGTLLPVRLVEGLSTDRNQAGDGFTATLDAPLIVDGFVLAERGSKLEGKVVESDKGGRVQGVSSLVIQLTRLTTSDGQHVAIQTASFHKNGDKSTKEDVAKVGVAAGIGAAIGAIAGGGKGAGIGAAAGGAAGTGGVLVTRGKAAMLPSETRINFKLQTAVTVTERR